MMTEGKLVTHGIMFDVNSDKIKPESYGTLKDIAAVPTENAGIKVNIIGHTDSKGEIQPIAPNDTPSDKSQNRRVEFIKL